MANPQSETLVSMISLWKDGKTLTAMEMLKVAFRPILEQRIARFSNRGVRRDDVRKVAEKLLEEAIESYNNPDISPVTHVSNHLQQMEDRISALRSDAIAMRAKAKGV